MKPTLNMIGSTIQTHWKQLFLFGAVFTVLFQVLMLVALMVRFQAIPNYTTFYNWPSSVITIIQSTPSWMDVWPIIAEEWLIEIGYMNYDYGMGISEWSLNVVPYRMFVLMIMGILLALCLQLVKSDSCAIAGTDNKVVQSGGAFAALSGGTLLVAMTNVTMSWVVCCATPSWVVGLAMLGLGVSTSLALESLGLGLSLGGFALLIFAVFYLAWIKTHKYQPLLEVTHA